MPRPKQFDEATVLERARDLFWERGYTATSIGDLEEHLGVSRSSLYQTFGGKRALYDRTLAAYQHENQTRLRLLLRDTDDLRATLTDLFVNTAAQHYPNCHTRARGCYVVNATTEMANACTEAFRFVADNRERFVAVLTDALARARVQGQLRIAGDDGLAELANYLFVCYNGLQVVVQTGIPRPELVAAMRRSLEALPWTPNPSAE